MLAGDIPTLAYASLSGLPTLGGAAALNVGTAPGTVAAGDHLHTGIYQPVGAYEPAFAVLGPAKGGTGIGAYTVGELLYASGATTLSARAAVAAGSVFVSAGAGAAPVWSSAPTLLGVLALGDGTNATSAWGEFGFIINAKPGNDAGIKLMPGFDACGFIDFFQAGQTGSKHGRIGRNATSAGASLFSGTGGNVSNGFQIGTRDATPLQFFTNDNGRIFINLQNVGIGPFTGGASVPQELLDVSNNTSGGLGGRLVVSNYNASAAGNAADVTFAINSNFTAGVKSARIRAISPAASNATDLAFLLWGSSEVERVRFTSTGNVGIGVTVFGTSGVAVLGIGNGTEPSTSPADMVQLYSVDLSAGNATLGLRTETAVVSEVVVSDRTLSVRINGTTYKLCLKA